MMVEIIFDTIMDGRADVLYKLEANEVYLSSEEFCKKLTVLESHNHKDAFDAACVACFDR